MNPLQDSARYQDGHIPWRLILLVFIALAVVTTAVPVFSWVHRPHETVFTGYSAESVGDIFVYLNLIDQAKHGATLFVNMFTPEAGHASLFHPFFLVLGRIALWFRLAPLTIWHIARVALIFPLELCVWVVLNRLPLTRRTKQIAFVAAFVTGGIAVPTGETSIFLSVLYSPKAIYSILSLFLFLLLFLRSLEGRTYRYLPIQIVLAVVQAFVQPYALFFWALCPTLFSFAEACINRRLIVRYMSAAGCAIVSVAVAYAALGWMVLRDPLLRSWSLTAEGGHWGPTLYLLLLGALVPFALAGLLSSGRALLMNRESRFLLFWALTAVLITLSPYPYAYRLMGGMQFPLTVLAVIGGSFIWRHSQTIGIGKITVLLFAVLSVSDSTQHLAKNLTGEYSGAGNRYLTTDQAALTDWLRHSTPNASVVLASPSWDTLLAQRAYRQVFVTSGWQTTHLIMRIQEALDIYAGKMSEEDLRRLLVENRIGYLVYGSLEHASGRWQSYEGSRVVLDYDFHSNFQLERYSFLRRVFSSGSETIYRVVNP